MTTESSVRSITVGTIMALLCMAVGAGASWYARGLTIERDVAIAQRATQRTADSLRLTIAQQWSAVTAAQEKADHAESLFVADSAKHLAAVRSLLRRIADLQAPDTTTIGNASVEPNTTGLPSLTEISSTLRGCALSITQCGDARAAAESVADSLRALNRTLDARHQSDSVRFEEQARAHAIALSRASGRGMWRDVKVAGVTSLALTAGCAVSHLGNPFRGR